MASKGQKYKKYTPEEKIRYAKMVVNGETSAKEIAKKLNTGHKTITRWRDWLINYGEDYFFEEHRGKNSGNPYAALHTSKNLSELERLKLENTKLKAENMKLKKEYMVKGAGAYRESVLEKERHMKSSKK